MLVSHFQRVLEDIEVTNNPEVVEVSNTDACLENIVATISDDDDVCFRKDVKHEGGDNIA